MMTNLFRLLAVTFSSFYLFGCATADRPSLVSTPTTAKPVAINSQAMSQGSLFPVATTASASYRPLFEDYRARSVGDTLIILLNETTSATKRSGSLAERKSSADIGIEAGKGIPGNVDLNKLNLSSSGGVKHEGTGNSAAANTFNGTITVTVLEVLANGNLVVAGEKQLGVSAEEEVIRFGGVVNPRNLINNTVSSAQVADTRIEYRGRGATDDVQQAGWLTRALMKLSPL